jgi:flagellar hook assembly protein FlgD
MQGQRQQRTNSMNTRRRGVSREERSPGVLFTAITIGAVVLLLSVTFVADWLRTPELTIISSPQFLSPNNDNSYDSAAISYNLSEEATVSAQVTGEGGGVIRSLLIDQQQSLGQHVVIWDGTDSTGRAAVDGRYTVQVTAKGSVRAKSINVALVVDTLPPTLQLLNLQDGTRVRDNQLTVEGVTDPGVSVFAGALPEQVVVDGVGRFHTQQKLNEGPNAITVRAVDEAGNTTTVSRTIDLVTEAPEVTITNPAEGAWINNPLVTVEGHAPAGITLKINNQPVQVAQDGAFRYDLLVDEGDQRITVSAQDDVGNVTTVERNVRVKLRGPALSLNIVEGASFSDPQIPLAGTTSPGATVLVNQRPVSVGALGDFQTTIALSSGENAITVEARDQAGNATSLTRRVQYAPSTAPGTAEHLLSNLNQLPVFVIPAIALLTIALGFFLYRQNQLSIQLTVDAQEFIPGLPQEGKNVVLRLELNQTSHVTLEVLDEYGQAQAVLLDNRRRTARQHVFLWDGYDDYGRPVPAGPYTIRATAGVPPIKVSSAVQLDIAEDPYVYHKAGQFERIQPLSPSVVARRRLRQNRKRI